MAKKGSNNSKSGGQAGASSEAGAPSTTKKTGKKTGKKKASKKKTSKKTTKKTATKTGKKTTKKSGSRGSGLNYTKGQASGKSLVIVESPAKAKTINKYLGDDYLVLASVGHIRDLPSKNPKGVKDPVPGVKIEKRFTPSYEVLQGKEQVVKDLKRAADDAMQSGGDVWFATDLDREGEAIAWHLAQLMGIGSGEAKRVIFPAITRTEIDRAFHNPHPIDEDRVNAQQARRILDRIVGYQVSPLLWKKVARGLSAGRVQSVAVRLIVEREREIRAFVPDEYWSVTGYFTLERGGADRLAREWPELLAQTDEKGKSPTLKAQNAWLSDKGAVRAELVEFDGEKFEPRVSVKKPRRRARGHVARRDRGAHGTGGRGVRRSRRARSDADGPVRVRGARARGVSGRAWRRTSRARAPRGGAARSRARSIRMSRTPSSRSRRSGRVRAPGSVHHLDDAAERVEPARVRGAADDARGAGALRGVNIPGEGPVGLITYMRTDSTHISGEALDRCARTSASPSATTTCPRSRTSSRVEQGRAGGARGDPPDRCLAHARRIKSVLKPDQHRLYDLIWRDSSRAR